MPIAEIKLTKPQRMALITCAIAGREGSFMDTTHAGMARAPLEALVNRGFLEVRSPWDVPSVRYVRPTPEGWARIEREVQDAAR